jgi:carbon monoxide dehydrogenase subunit G
MPITPFRKENKELNYQESYTQLDDGTIAKNIIDFSDNYFLYKSDASSVLSYDASGQLTSIVKTIGATSYTKTFTWTDHLLTNISSWS